MDTTKPNLRDLIKKAVDEQVQKSLQDKQKTDRQVSFQLVEDKAPVEIVKDEVVKLQEIVQDKIEDLIESNVVGFKKIATKENEKVTPSIQALNNNLVTSLKDLKKAVGEVERATKANKPLPEQEETFEPVVNAVKSLEKAFKAIKLVLPTDPENPVAVRFSDGEKWLNQLTQIVTRTQGGVGGGGGSAFETNGGPVKPEAIVVNGKTYTATVSPYTLLSERVANTDGASTAFSNFPATTDKASYITAYSIINTSASDGYVDFRDGTSGTILWTVPLPAGGGANLAVKDGIFKTSKNKALAFDVSAALTTVYISVSGYQSTV